MDTNMININCVTFEVTFEAQFMKKSTNTGVELKKSVAYKKKAWNSFVQKTRSVKERELQARMPLTTCIKSLQENPI